MSALVQPSSRSHLHGGGSVEFYVPAGTWTGYRTGEVVQGRCWRREQHGLDGLPP